MASLTRDPRFLWLLAAVLIHLVLAGLDDAIPSLTNAHSYALSLALVALGGVLAWAALRSPGVAR